MSVKLSIKSICSRFFYERYFRDRNRYARINNLYCRCDEDGPRCCCAQAEKCERPVQATFRSMSCSDGLFNEEDGGAGNRRIYPTEEAVRHRSNYNPTRSTFKDDCYAGVKNPYILIINNVNFHTMVAARSGADADVQNLMEFFSYSGFTSIVKYDDVLRSNMLHYFKITRENPALLDHDAFICVIMTHGDANGVKGVDDWNSSIEMEEITSLFLGDKCPQLMTKPKLFFIQACRGVKLDNGYLVPRGESGGVVADSDEKGMVVKLPSEADILVAYSTTKNHVSFRTFTDNARAMVEQRETMGSWFISCMAQVFQKHSHREDLMTMLAKVNRAMTELYTGGNSETGNKQISCQVSMLTKSLYFARYWEEGRGQFY